MSFVLALLAANYETFAKTFQTRYLSVTTENLHARIA